VIELPRDGFRAMPWANGGGVTHEVMVWPLGAAMADFDWRVSLAEVREPGPFSALPGVDRLLLLVDGAGMTLRVDGTEVEASRESPLAFAGEADSACVALADGPTLDLNVMTRRGRWSASLVVGSGDVTCASGERVLVLDLVTLDAALLDPGESLRLAVRSAVVHMRSQ